MQANAATGTMVVTRQGWQSLRLGLSNELTAAERLCIQRLQALGIRRLGVLAVLRQSR